MSNFKNAFCGALQGAALYGWIVFSTFFVRLSRIPIIPQVLVMHTYCIVWYIWRGSAWYNNLFWNVWMASSLGAN